MRNSSNVPRRVGAPLLAAGLALAGGPALVGTAAAHDLWLEPDLFEASDARSPIAVHVRVGERLTGEAVPRSERRILRFVALGAGDEVPIEGVDGVEPAGWLRLPSDGATESPAATGSPPPSARGATPPTVARAVDATTWVLGYQSDHATIELAAARFERYLRDEGLEHVIARRAESGRTDAPGREAYARCAKSLVAIGARGVSGADAARSADALHGRRLGCPLELVPELDPYRLRPGEQLPVRLLFRGEPIAGVRVAALSRERPEDVRVARTGRDGRALFTLDREGLWLVKAVHMEAAPPGLDADWESWWASLTFLRRSE